MRAVPDGYAKVLREKELALRGFMRGSASRYPRCSPVRGSAARQKLRMQGLTLLGWPCWGLTGAAGVLIIHDRFGKGSCPGSGART